MKLLHPDMVPQSMENVFTFVYSGIILNDKGVHFKMKLLHPEMVPLSKGNIFTSVCSGVILK